MCLPDLQTFSLVAAFLCFAYLPARLLCFRLWRFGSIACSALLTLFGLLGLLTRIHQNFIKEVPNKRVGHHWKMKWVWPDQTDKIFKITRDSYVN